MIRICVTYGGVPIVWQVLEHKSSTVSYETYKPLLDAACALMASGVEVVFLADAIERAFMTFKRIVFGYVRTHV